MNETLVTTTSSDRNPWENRRKDDRKQEALRIATARFQASPDWVTYFREILGVGGLVRRLFPQDGDLLEFEKTSEHAEIQLMLARLRQNSENSSDPPEPTRVITVRLPKSLHEALQARAHLHQTSMNKLCIARLLHVIDNEFTGNARKDLQEVPVILSEPQTEKGEGDL